ncbi:hypothetical protein [Stenotrophomonas sp. GZD-301]|uniref:hypothetical protein n=1 Tax=Stenotrophomonas sp. GZD-301 TaxID=3404814 RepID=UPI003BB71909
MQPRHGFGIRVAVDPGGDAGNMADIGPSGLVDLVGMGTTGKRGGTKRDIDDAFSL